MIGRVARRIWAVAMRDRYGANERCQKLKYHIQTSGRSLHAQEIALQRHPHDAAGAARALRQLQLAAHQRLRRGDHDADRGERAPRDGDPADHQPRVRPGEEREPEPGLLHHRGADRPGRGGGARRVRAHLRARRRAGRDGDRLPARQDPGRVPPLREAQAHRRAADRRRQHLPQPARRRGAAARSSCTRSTEEEKQSQLARLAGLPGAQRRARRRRRSSACRRP